VANQLSARIPEVSTAEILRDLIPPPHFRSASFENYLPDAGQPSQAAALGALRAFASRFTESGGAKRGFFRRGAPPEARAGVYLDGGFGVGKTHLLAALWNVAPQPKTYGTFVEYTNLVGLLGFRSAVDALAANRLVCIDEFELDDPGDTVLLSTLLGELVERGVRLAATSNTLPEKLGEGRFAAEDFLREIQGLSAHFDVLRIEGEDYRHRELIEVPTALTDEEVRDAVHRIPDAVLDEFDEILAHLAKVHPSRYGALVGDIPLLGLTGGRTVTDQAQALRLVVLIDRLYDRDVPVLLGGVAPDRIFGSDMLTGGYRKKYFRAISRLVSLAQSGGAVIG
jgi:cell division protein ZapE